MRPSMPIRHQQLQAELEALSPGTWVPPARQCPLSIAELVHLLTVQTAVGTSTDYQLFVARWRSRLPFSSENFDVGLPRGRYGNLVVAHFLPAAPWAPDLENAYRYLSMCLLLGKVFPPMPMHCKAYVLEKAATDGISNAPHNRTLSLKSTAGLPLN